jgi:hypothetical protein
MKQAADSPADQNNRQIEKISNETLIYQLKLDKNIVVRFRQKLSYFDTNMHDFFAYFMQRFVLGDKKTEKIFEDFLFSKFEVGKKHTNDANDLKKIKGTFDELDKETLYDLISKELDNE